jgi:hypothetical protein
MPLIALIRPQGTTLAESHLFVRYEGRVGESTLLSSMRIEHNAGEGEIIQNQDDEYNAAVMIDEANVRRTQEEIDAGEARAVELEITRAAIAEEFNRIPLPVDQTDRTIIRFQFPGGGDVKIQRFSRGAPVRWVFVYVRKFMFPKQFLLLTGFPAVKLDESDKPLGEVCAEKQFMVHVQEVDEE